MCRFLAYKGKSILINELLYEPKNSLIRQSARAHEAEEPLNGDGFGVGWYASDITSEPGLYVSVRPAWNDRNLRHLCGRIKTDALFAHVRAASEGEVSEANCHPFHFKRYLFMHNGGIGGFQKLKRQIRRKLSDEIYDWIRGQTDSEHLFALILENLKNRDGKPTAVELAAALEATVREIQAMKASAGIGEACYINCALTDGNVIVVLRYVSDLSEKASTLYYADGHHYECHDGICTMVPGNGDQSILIVSEKLTRRPEDWKEIPTNEMCIVDETMHVKLRPIDDGVIRDLKTPTSEPVGRGFKLKRHG